MTSCRKAATHLIAIAMLGLAGLSQGCTSVSVQFPVEGKPVEKYFALTSQDAKSPVVEALRKDDLPGALKLMEEKVQSKDVMPYDHYRLAVLLEASSDWDAAEKSINDAIALDKEKFKSKKPSTTFTDELKFIQEHKKSK